MLDQWRTNSLISLSLLVDHQPSLLERFPLNLQLSSLSNLSQSQLRQRWEPLLLQTRIKHYFRYPVGIIHLSFWTVRIWIISIGYGYGVHVLFLFCLAKKGALIVMMCFFRSKIFTQPKVSVTILAPNRCYMVHMQLRANSEQTLSKLRARGGLSRIVVKNPGSE